MDRKEFFRDFHHRLANKYTTTDKTIRFIRSLHLGCNFSREAISLRCTEKIDLFAYQLLSYPKCFSYKVAIEKRRGYLNFLLNLSNDQWNDIVQKTRFDH